MTRGIKGQSVSRVCVRCGTAFGVPQWVIDSGRGRYCSRACINAQTIEERFWPRVDKRGPVPPHRPDLGPCWLWTGAKNNKGYGQLGLTGRGAGSVLAHRLAYNLLVGPIPDGLQLDHLCRNRTCVNPAHLEPVTHQENLRRGIRANQNTGKTHCPQGHPYDDENTYHLRGGGRMCKECSRIRLRARREKERQTRRSQADDSGGWAA